MEVTKNVILTSTKMTPFGPVTLFPAKPTSVFFLPPYVLKKNLKYRPIAKFSVSNVMAESTIERRTGFGFKNLSKTFWVDVHRAEGRPLNVILDEPLNLGSLSVEKVENVGIRIELSNGCVGWGEVSVAPLVSGTVQSKALVKVQEACQFLRQNPPMTMNLVLDLIDEILPGVEFASEFNLNAFFVLRDRSLVGFAFDFSA